MQPDSGRFIVAPAPLYARSPLCYLAKSENLLRPGLTSTVYDCPFDVADLKASIARGGRHGGVTDVTLFIRTADENLLTVPFDLLCSPRQLHGVCVSLLGRSSFRLAFGLKRLGPDSPGILLDYTGIGNGSTLHEVAAACMGVGGSDDAVLFKLPFDFSLADQIDVVSDLTSELVCGRCDVSCAFHPESNIVLGNTLTNARGTGGHTTFAMSEYEYDLFSPGSMIGDVTIDFWRRWYVHGILIQIIIHPHFFLFYCLGYHVARIPGDRQRISATRIL